MEKNFRQDTMTPPGLIIGRAPLELHEYNMRIMQLVDISIHLGGSSEHIQGIRTKKPTRSSKEGEKEELSLIQSSLS